MPKGVIVTQQMIKVIEAILAKDDRVELIPMSEGKVNVVRIRRESVKIEHCTSP